jgi:hypothetical protein
VIAVFTKYDRYDQFRRDMRMKLEDQGHEPDDLALLNAEMERIFKEEFLANLKGSPPNEGGDTLMPAGGFIPLDSPSDFLADLVLPEFSRNKR